MEFTPDGLGAKFTAQLNHPSYSPEASSGSIFIDDPGDWLEFGIPISNEGTLGAYVDGITVTGINDQNKKYLNLDVTVGSPESDFDPVVSNSLLPGYVISNNFDDVAGPILANTSLQNFEALPMWPKPTQYTSQAFLYVRLEYIGPADPKDLPAEDATVEIEIHLDATQSDLDQFEIPPVA